MYGEVTELNAQIGSLSQIEIDLETISIDTSSFQGGDDVE